MPKAAHTQASTPPQPADYTIQIREHLPENWSEGYEGLRVAYTAAGETLLKGTIADQAALHGLLARIRDLNLTLIAVRREA